MDGNNALVGFEGFMKGWNFGQSILKGNEDAADREQARKDAADQRAYQKQKQAREQVVQGREDEQYNYELGIRQTPEEVKAARAAEAEKSGLDLQKLRNEVSSAATPEEARAKRQAELEAEKARTGYTKAQTARLDAEAKKDGADTSMNKQLAALDYVTRNQELLRPENLSAIDRVYQGLSLNQADKIQPGDFQAAATAMIPLLDKRQEFNGKPIVSKTAIPHFNKDKGTVVMELAYKVRNPDGSIEDANAGPLRKATQDGTDAVYELRDDEAMQLLAGHQLIGREFSKLLQSGGVTPQQAIDSLREQIISGGGQRGAAAAKAVTQPERPENVTQRDIKIGESTLTTQYDKAQGLDDSTPVIAGTVTRPDGKIVQPRTLGEAKAAASGQAVMPAAAKKPTLQEFLAAARSKNSKMTDEQLSAYYAKTYGG